MMVTGHAPNEAVYALSFPHVGTMSCLWMGNWTNLAVGMACRQWGQQKWVVEGSNDGNGPYTERGGICPLVLAHWPHGMPWGGLSVQLGGGWGGGRWGNRVVWGWLWLWTMDDGRNKRA
jgi:hypothetical protein